MSNQGTQIHGNLFLQTYNALTGNPMDVVDKAGLVAGSTTILLGSGTATTRCSSATWLARQVIVTSSECSTR